MINQLNHEPQTHNLARLRLRSAFAYPSLAIGETMNYEP